MKYFHSLLMGVLSLGALFARRRSDKTKAE